MSRASLDRFYTSADPKAAAMRLLSAITHDDRDSNYIICTRDHDGSWTESTYRVGETLPDIADGREYYFSHNGFKGSRRRNDEARQLNALFFDIDAHDPMGSYREAVDAIIATLACAISSKSIPMPTAMVDSGRGVHLYYVLDRSTPVRLRSGAGNTSGLELATDAWNAMADQLDAIIAPLEGCDCDRAVSDLARVSRIPGSWNASARSRCNVVFLDERTRYPLVQLAHVGKAAKKTAPRTRTFAPNSAHRLLNSRIERTHKLMELRGGRCEGSRENMCFAYYNAAVQVMGPLGALNALKDLNASFSSPLAASEISCIPLTVARAISHEGSSGHYSMSASTFDRFLGVTEQEAIVLGGCTTSKQARRQQVKQDNKLRRETRDRKALELYKTTHMTQAKIAEVLGCSARTVWSAVNSAKFKRVATALKVLVQKGLVLRKSSSQFLAPCIGGVATAHARCVSLGSRLPHLFPPVRYPLRR